VCNTGPNKTRLGGFQVEVLWVVTPCSVVRYKRFGGPCCLHLQGEEEIEATWTSEILVSYDRGFDSRRRLGIFLFTTASRTVLGPTQPLIQWVAGALSPGIKRPGREADHSPPSSAEAKDWVELYLHSPNTPSWRGVRLKKVQGRPFIFPFTIHYTALQTRRPRVELHRRENLKTP
jgi:hypothetical protein